MEAVMAVNQTTTDNKTLVYATRFGDVKLREDRLITFSNGILGFDACTVFGLSTLPNTEESPFLLLQCVNEPEVGFLVADPNVLGLEISDEDKVQAFKDTGLKSEDTQFLVILTMYDQEDSYYLTANLRAPIMVDSRTRQARQYILSNKKYTTQHKI